MLRGWNKRKTDRQKDRQQKIEGKTRALRPTDNWESEIGIPGILKCSRLAGKENTGICYFLFCSRDMLTFFCLGSSRQGTGEDIDEEKQRRERGATGDGRLLKVNRGVRTWSLLRWQPWPGRLLAPSGLWQPDQARSDYLPVSQQAQGL